MSFIPGNILPMSPPPLSLRDLVLFASLPPRTTHFSGEGNEASGGGGGGGVWFPLCPCLLLLFLLVLLLTCRLLLKVSQVNLEVIGDVYE